MVTMITWCLKASKMLLLSILKIYKVYSKFFILIASILHKYNGKQTKQYINISINIMESKLTLKRKTSISVRHKVEQEFLKFGKSQVGIISIGIMYQPINCVMIHIQIK